MKQLVLLFFATILSVGIHAQSEVQLFPSSLEYVLTTDLSQPSAQAIARSIVVNQSDRTIDLQWEREQTLSQCPEAWTLRICDKNKYHAASTFSNVLNDVNEPIELNPGDSTILDIHVLPNGTPGSCELDIQLKDVDNPKTIFQVASFNLTLNDYSTPVTANSSGLRVFPNPTTQFISMPNNDRVKQLWVSNILGKQVKTFDTNFNGQYDLSSLPDGIYLVSMVDGYGKVLKTVRLSKRGIRP